MKMGLGNWCRGVLGAGKATAAVAIGLSVLAGNLPAADFFSVTADTYIEKDFPIVDNSGKDKMYLNNNGTGGGSRYGLVYFDIPQSTLEAFSAAWDAANSATPDGFDKVKAVLQINSLQSASGNVRVLKATKDWHSDPAGANWETWSPVPGAGHPSWLEGIPSETEPAYKFIGIGNNIDGQVEANRPGTMQIGVTQYHTGQAVTRSILDWARNAGVGPASPYTGMGTPGNDPQNVPNHGFVLVSAGGQQVEIASSEYATAQGGQYAPKLILYREPQAPEDTFRAMDSSKIWDVYQPPNMLPTSDSNANTGPPPQYPTVPFPAAQGANEWYEPGYNVTGVAGWNVNPDSLYNSTAVTVGAPITNNGGIYGHPGKPNCEPMAILIAAKVGSEIACCHSSHLGE